MLPDGDPPRLEQGEQGWQLCCGKVVVRVDFESGAATYRRLHGGGRGELLARAVGLKPANRIPSVMDATAGLGRDAFLLASLGCRVDLFERSEPVRILLEDGLTRARGSADPAVRDAIGRMVLHPVDAMTVLRAPGGLPLADVIYLDPMFPDRQKSAAVKKEMAMFQALLADEPADADALLACALAAAPCRVVVKRPRRAPPLGGKDAPLVLEGQSTRFDIYPLRSLSLG